MGELADFWIVEGTKKGHAKRSEVSRVAQQPLT
jgi:hypothetical protein